MMFEKATNKMLQWLDHGQVLGIVKINDKHDFKKQTKRPIKRNQGAVIVSLGRVNYALLDEFIMRSLNDYYSKINTCKDFEERKRRIAEYNTLYSLWYQVNVARQNQDFALNSYYDDIVYQLYLLGYHS